MNAGGVVVFPLVLYLRHQYYVITRNVAACVHATETNQLRAVLHLQCESPMQLTNPVKMQSKPRTEQGDSHDAGTAQCVLSEGTKDERVSVRMLWGSGACSPEESLKFESLALQEMHWKF